jgi:hypothetical protein
MVLCTIVCDSFVKSNYSVLNFTYILENTTVNLVCMAQLMGVDLHVTLFEGLWIIDPLFLPH